MFAAGGASAQVAGEPKDGGQPLRAVVEQLMKASPRVRAAGSDAVGADARVSEAWRRAYTPNLDLTAEAGRQRYESVANADPSALTSYRTTMRATQLVTDFGRTSAQIDEARFAASQSNSIMAATRDGVLLEALTAHWSVVRADMILTYSRQSEASVRKQTELESSMVELGKGYESNVLQAKVQLASAEASRVRAEGGLDIAKGRVRAVFGDLAGDVGYGEVALPNEALMPKSLDEAMSRALKNNKQIEIGQFRSQALEKRLESTDAREFRPRVQVVAEHSWRKNIDVSVKGPDYEDSKLMLQLQYTLNSGMAGRSATEATRRDLEASRLREVETRDLVFEQVHVAWRNLKIAQQNKDTLSNQVRIAAKYFEMAMAERQMGRRSLLDVLTAEVSLINAVSDLVATEADAAIAGLTLLQAVGSLQPDALVTVPTEKAVTKTRHS
ncbi:TolC family protein [Niveispirillum sp.]|uniref:TolC family protein n=1 Tax=Niveispirillum sp. TaxID=1917217 RepID=UPI001B3EC992|nr:TolC family protein [Niveispirillum sp.]MBP7336181.1 TolC family protein [Niveispirillum sp.]